MSALLKPLYSLVIKSLYLLFVALLLQRHISSTEPRRIRPAALNSIVADPRILSWQRPEVTLYVFSGVSNLAPWLFPFWHPSYNRIDVPSAMGRCPRSWEGASVATADTHEAMICLHCTKREWRHSSLVIGGPTSRSSRCVLSRFHNRTVRTISLADTLSLVADFSSLEKKHAVVRCR